MANIHYFIQDLCELAKHDLQFDEIFLIRVKSNIRQDTSIFEAHQLFRDFPSIQTLLRILMNYEFLINEFKTIETPFAGTAENSKHFKSKINTLLNSLNESLELFRLLNDTIAIQQTQKIISILEEFLNDPKELIKKLHFFQILERTSKPEIRDILLNLIQHNPFDDKETRKYEDIAYYLNLLTLLDGYDTTEAQLTTSTLIKIYKIPDFKNASKILDSLCAKLGFQKEVNPKRLENIQLKTFYRGIAIFDYSTNNERILINKYFVEALEIFKMAVIHEAILKKSSLTKSTITENIEVLNANIVKQLLEF